MGFFHSVYTAGPSGLWIFLLVSVFMGASTAYVSGRAIAETWRPFWHGIVYALIIGLAVRFIHFALFEEVLLSVRNYVMDCIFLVAAGSIGYIRTRQQQMRHQYAFLTDGSRNSNTKAREHQDQ